MINVNDKLIREELPHIGCDALTILLVISSHLGVNRTAWPGIERIRNMATVETAGEMRPMSKKRTYAALKKLEDRKLITRKQEKAEGGVFSHTVYKVSSKYLSIYVKANNELEETHRVVESDYTDDHRVVEFRNTENRNAESDSLSINKEEVLIKDRSINKEEVSAESLFDFEKLPWQRATEFLLQRFEEDRFTRGLIKASMNDTGWKGNKSDLKQLFESVFRNCEDNSSKYGFLIYSLPGNKESYQKWISKVMSRVKTFMGYRVKDQEKNSNQTKRNIPIGFKKQTV